MTFYDLAYSFAALISAPAWLLFPRARKKVQRALDTRMSRELPPRPGDSPAVLIHAVSLGEINATRTLVRELHSARPDLHLILSTTTETGHTRARELYANTPNTTLLRFPLDLTPAITRTLNALRPDLVVLMELEVWPNFLHHCRKRHIPVIVINARLTPHSLKRYRLIRPIARRMFSRLSHVAAQDKTYADQFVSLGVPPANVSVTGTMKFDTAEIADTVPGSDALARDLHLNKGDTAPYLLLVAGSTGPGEEQIILDSYRELLKEFPTLRLAIIPRHPERFNEVANLITQSGFQLIRRSSSQQPVASSNPVLLGDTMGELRKFYSLATVVFVGRTLVDLGPRQRGSDMIEPAALAKPTLVGPFTQNFAEPMNAFRAADALYELPTPASLLPTLSDILRHPAPAAEKARRAQQTVRQNQGATAAHAKLILSHLSKTR